MCDKAADFNLITLKFVTNNMLEKLDNYLFSDDHIFFHDADSNIIIFLTDDMDFNTIDFNNIIFTLIKMIFIKMIQRLLIMLDL